MKNRYRTIFTIFVPNITICIYVFTMQPVRKYAARTFIFYPYLIPLIGCIFFGLSLLAVIIKATKNNTIEFSVVDLLSISIIPILFLISISPLAFMIEFTLTYMQYGLQMYLIMVSIYVGLFIMKLRRKTVK